ncbi:MAG: PEP-CTERM sorting domain-containing protein [Desulfatitalea sp.]|nr:PEP-CTERM sorting domain-containing protein [Desulfatitalea sp.]
MGVSGWIGGDDEIGLKEMISLSFFSNLGELKSVLISSFTVSDLFENEFFCADEEGGFKYSPGGLPTIFSPADGDYNPDGGILTYHFDQPVAAANFTFFGVKSLFGWKDFAIQSLDLVDVASVPEPATMLLFGTGLIGIAGVSRKKFLR